MDIAIHRFKENPLIVPSDNIPWMTENAFNPGVIKDATGMFHMLIRGGTYRRHQEYSNLGYASSKDGVSWVVSAIPRLKYTDYSMAEKGIEDPRIVRWDGAFYIFATASHKYYGRVGIWRTENFIDFEWVGSPFDWEDKNACIIPEVINNRVYLIHRMYPNMWIAETTDVALGGSWANNRILLRAEEIKVDGKVPLKIGLATPPVKLGNDWLVLFHAVFEPFEYRISFMLLDGVDLSVKYLHSKSILKPELACEKYGAVPYVCFLTGIVDMGDKFYLYWGGADTVICGGYLLKREVMLF